MKLSWNLNLNRRARRPWTVSWRALIAALLLWAAGGSAAMAAIVINSITVNGGSSATVLPGASLTVVVQVTLTGASKWRSTYFTTTPSSSNINGCAYGPVLDVPGTYYVTFNLTAPSTQNVFQLNVWTYGHPGCGTSQGGASANLPGAINTNPPAALNHVRILHDGSGLTCSPETVNLRACGNASCTTLYTPSVTVALGTTSGSVSPTTATITNGTGSFVLTKTTTGNAVLSGTVTSPSGNAPVQCYVNGVAGTCTVVFAATSCTLDAVEPGAAPGTDIFTKRTGANVTLDVLTLQGGSLNTSPTSVTAVLVDGSVANCAGATVSNALTKSYVAGNGGRQSYVFTPNKAVRNARVRLTSPTTSQCSTDSFAIRPDSFVVTTPASGASADSTGTSGTATPTLPAGVAGFTLNAASFEGYDETPQLNNLRTAAAPFSPTDPAVLGTLTGSFGQAAAATGIASGTNFSYTEVGYVKLLPYAVYDDGDFANIDRIKGNCLTSANLTDDDPITDPNVPIGGKLGCYFGNLETLYFGRFTPSHYTLEPGATLLNRSALTSCAAPTFTYVGEPLSVTFDLVAKNNGGGTTQNYRGKFVRLDLSTQSGLAAVNDPATGSRTRFPTCGPTPAHPCVSAGTATAAWDDGVGTITLPVTATRDSTRSGPYSNFQVGIAPVDADNIMLNTASLNLDTVSAVLTPGVVNHARVGTTDLRYGRMKIENTYGSELLNMGIKVGAQYWNDTGWAANTADSCTPLTMTPTALFTLSGHTGGITFAPTNTMPDSKLLGGTVMQNGSGLIRLEKPTTPPASKGSVLVNSTSPYLPGSGRATFGVYKAGPVIYVRETY